MLRHFLVALSTVALAAAMDPWYDGVIVDGQVRPSRAIRGDAMPMLNAPGVKKGTPFFWLRQNAMPWIDTLTYPNNLEYLNVPDGDGSKCTNCPCTGYGSYEEVKAYETDPSSPLTNQIVVGRVTMDDKLPPITFPRAGKWFLCLAHVKEPQSCNLGGARKVCPSPSTPKSLFFQWTEEDARNPTMAVWYAPVISGAVELARTPKAGMPSGPMRAMGVKKGTPFLWLRYSATPWVDSLAYPFNLEYVNVPDGDGSACTNCPCAGFGSFEQAKAYQNNPSSPLANQIVVGRAGMDDKLPTVDFPRAGKWFLCLAQMMVPRECELGGPVVTCPKVGMPATPYYQWTAQDAMGRNPMLTVMPS